MAAGAAEESPTPVPATPFKAPKKLRLTREQHQQQRRRLSLGAQGNYLPPYGEHVYPKRQSIPPDSRPAFSYPATALRGAASAYVLHLSV